MLKHFLDYYWQEGVPKGIQHIDPQQKEINFKIVSDPYHKWISIEKYKGLDFSEIVYDSAIFDFRWLKTANTAAWQKESEGDKEDRYLIRNHDDRLILVENYSFKNFLCHTCTTLSPHGILISTQKIQRKKEGDPKNGVALFDRNGHMVMYKLYEVDSLTGEFSDLIQENWNMMFPNNFKNGNWE